MSKKMIAALSLSLLTLAACSSGADLTGDVDVDADPVVEDEALVDELDAAIDVDVEGDATVEDVDADTEADAEAAVEAAVEAEAEIVE